MSPNKGMPVFRLIHSQLLLGKDILVFLFHLVNSKYVFDEWICTTPRHHLHKFSSDDNSICNWDYACEQNLLYYHIPHPNIWG